MGERCRRFTVHQALRDRNLELPLEPGFFEAIFDGFKKALHPRRWFK